MGPGNEQHQRTEPGSGKLFNLSGRYRRDYRVSPAVRTSARLRFRSVGRNSIDQQWIPVPPSTALRVGASTRHSLPYRGRTATGLWTGTISKGEGWKIDAARVHHRLKLRAARFGKGQGPRLTPAILRQPWRMGCSSFRTPTATLRLRA